MSMVGLTSAFPKLMPHSDASCAIFSACACSRSALVGMQPQLRHVPPSTGCRSTTATVRPSCAARMAATYPPVPEPITTTSNWSAIRPIVACPPKRETPVGRETGFPPDGRVDERCECLLARQYGVLQLLRNACLH